MSTVSLAFVITALSCVGEDIAPLSVEYNAYWITDSLIEAGEAYGPILLLSRAPLAQLKVRSDLRETARQLRRINNLPLLESAALYLATHRKDSIWNDDGHPIKSVGRVTQVNRAERIIAIDGRRYHFEPCRIEDAISLLENPSGKQPLHRIHAPLAGARQTARALKLLLKEQIAKKPK